MPLYPMVSGAISNLFNVESLIGLIIVTNISFFASLPLMLLVLRQLKLGDDTARFGVWLLAFSPSPPTSSPVIPSRPLWR